MFFFFEEYLNNFFKKQLVANNILQKKINTLALEQIFHTTK